MKRNITTIIICFSVIFCLIQNQLNNIENTINILNKNLKKEKTVKTSYANFPYKKYAGRFTATFYCDCPLCVGHKQVIKTKTGNIPYPHKTIAVDPNIIPLHSIVYIKDMGFFVAEDVGGHIKGKRIDIFVSNHEEALTMGKKTVDIYILK